MSLRPDMAATMSMSPPALQPPCRSSPSRASTARRAARFALLAALLLLAVAVAAPAVEGVAAPGTMEGVVWAAPLTEPPSSASTAPPEVVAEPDTAAAADEGPGSAANKTTTPANVSAAAVGKALDPVTDIMRAAGKTLEDLGAKAAARLAQAAAKMRYFGSHGAAIVAAKAGKFSTKHADIVRVRLIAKLGDTSPLLAKFDNIISGGQKWTNKQIDHLAKMVEKAPSSTINHVDNLKNVKGINKRVEEWGRNAVGRTNLEAELKVASDIADDIGAANMKAVGEPFTTPSGKKGDIDVYVSDSKLVEVKNGNSPSNIMDSLEDQVPKLQEFKPSADIDVYVKSNLVSDVQSQCNTMFGPNAVTVKAI